MQNKVTAKNTVKRGALQVVADASELGLQPGQWPERIETTLGNKMPFQKSGLDLLDGECVGCTYRQPEGLVLYVYND